MTEPFAIAKSHAGADVVFRPSMANRHGLITGANARPTIASECQMNGARRGLIGRPADRWGRLSRR